MANSHIEHKDTGDANHPEIHLSTSYYMLASKEIDLNTYDNKRHPTNSIIKRDGNVK